VCRRLLLLAPQSLRHQAPHDELFVLAGLDAQGVCENTFLPPASTHWYTCAAAMLHGEQAEKAGHKGRVEGVTHGGSGGAVAAV
jgi:hypothetical protein